MHRVIVFYCFNHSFHRHYITFTKSKKVAHLNNMKFTQFNKDFWKKPGFVLFLILLSFLFQNPLRLFGIKKKSFHIFCRLLQIHFLRLKSYKHYDFFFNL